MRKRIVIIQGHPDPEGQHLCHAAADAYKEGALSAGYQVDVIDVAQLDFPVLRAAKDWEKGDTPSGLITAQQVIVKADHLVIFYPLWLGTMPALLKAFLEQVFRPSLNVTGKNDATAWRSVLKGTSARIVVTMGMPAIVYRWFFRAHSLKSLHRNILAFLGIGPVRNTLVGMVEGMKPARAERLFALMKTYGNAAR